MKDGVQREVFRLITVVATVTVVGEWNMNMERFLVRF